MKCPHIGIGQYAFCHIETALSFTIAFQLKGRTLRVDHVSEYRKPKDDEELDETTQKLREEGCAPKTPPSQEEEEAEDDSLLPLKSEKERGMQQDGLDILWYTNRRVH